MTYQSYDLPRFQWLPNTTTMENTGQFHFDSFCVLSISLLLMTTHNHYVMLLISHYLFCICTCTFIYTAYMQMTLPIHVNTLNLINYFHFPRFYGWQMVATICHQRRTTAPFSVLTNLIFISENCHQSMISSLNLLFHVDQNLVCYKWTDQHLSNMQ